MNEQIAYRKAVIEGAPDIEPWRQWFSRNSGELSRMLSRKLCRIKAIPEILGRFSVAFRQSDRYAWLGGVEGLCRYCGGEVISTGRGGSYCPNGCYQLMV